MTGPERVMSNEGKSIERLEKFYRGRKALEVATEKYLKTKISFFHQIQSFMEDYKGILENLPKEQRKLSEEILDESVKVL